MFTFLALYLSVWGHLHFHSLTHAFLCSIFCIQDLDIGAKNVKLYVNKSLIFDGVLDKGGGKAPFDCTIPVDLQSEKIESPEKALHADWEGSKSALRMASVNGDKQLGHSCSQPAEALVEITVSSQGDLLGERVNSTHCPKDSLSKSQEDVRLLAASASMGDGPSIPSFSSPGKCPPLEEEPSLIQQLENLKGKRIPEPSGKTPHWLQPSLAGMGKKQAGRKPKPLWLSPEKDLEQKSKLLLDDVIGDASGEVEAREKGPRREQGRTSSWNVITEERPQRASSKACGDDLDIFSQPPNRDRPASGRRALKKDASGSHGDDQPASKGKLREASVDMKPFVSLDPGFLIYKTRGLFSSRSHKSTVPAGEVGQMRDNWALCMLNS